MGELKSIFRIRSVPFNTGWRNEAATVPGIGAKRCQAEPLTKEEEQLWQTGQLGDHSPQAQVDTMLFMHGIYFVLRSDHDHCNLRFKLAQVDLVDRAGERAYVCYTEDISENNREGLKGRKNNPKVVTL